MKSYYLYLEVKEVRERQLLYEQIKLIDTENKLNGCQIGGWVKKWRNWEVQIGSLKIGNIVKTTKGEKENGEVNFKNIQG